MTRDKVVLIVEDEPGAALLQKRRLVRAGFRADVASSVDVALDVLRHSQVDLVVVDYRLGSTTGLDLMRRMRAAGHDTPVIVVSGAIDDQSVIEALRAGARDVVEKDQDYLEYLPDAVRSVLQQAAPSAPGAADARGGAVLIVEDDQGVARLEQRELERSGYDVRIARDGDEAISTLRAGGIGLMLLDLRLGGQETGLDVYERARAMGWNLPAILVTAYPDQAVAIRAIRAGVRDLVPKADEFVEQLPARVDRVIAEQRAELRLVDSELRLASIVGTAMDAILMCDEQLRVVLFNPAAEDMFGLSADAATGALVSRFIPALSRDPWAAEHGRAAGAPLRQRIETLGVRNDGTEMPLELAISDVTLQNRRLFTVTARDVSERKRQDTRLREADRRKDVFLGMLAHELRNPLAAVSNAGTLLARISDNPDIQRIAAIITRQTRSLSRMVDDLLDVSRVTLGKVRLVFDAVEVAETLARSVEAIRDDARRAELTLSVHIDAPLPVRGDAARLEQVFTNLLNNAVKFTGPGGRIEISAQRRGDTVEIVVRDSGIGIERELLPNVFELFVQGDTSLDRAKSGLGLGLALVQQVVTLHGGRVSAASAGPGFGSEFVVHLPAISTPPAAEPPIDDLHAAPASNGRRVLVVDDQRDVADSMAMVLQSFGFATQVAYGGAAGLQLIREHRPEVAFVDLGMPGLTGYEVARAVRRDRGLDDVKLVALTGYGREEDRARVLEAGFDQHVTKPVDGNLLLKLLAPGNGGTGE